MATYNFKTYLDDLYIESGSWAVTQLSSTQITLEGAEFRIVLAGTGFAVGSSGDPLGTITSVKVYGYDYATGSPVQTLVVDGSGLNHSLAGFVEAAESGYYGGVDFLFNGNDTLNGSASDDEMTGFAGNDTLNGGNGNDWLDGGAGADTMSGGAGDDVFVVDNAGDKVVEVAGQGTRDRVEFDNGEGLLSYTLAANVENLSVFHWYTPTPSVMTAKGNEQANKISVDQYYDSGYQEKLYGMAGNDRLSSGGGNDTLDGGIGNDIMLGGFGSDTYYVDSNLDKVLEDVIPDPQSSDIDTVVYTVATAGATASLGGVVSGLTNSITFGQIENLNLGLSTATTTALNGVGSTLANKLIGNAAVNKLYGLAGNDQLYGHGGADQLFGDIGNDVLDGGAGNDVLNGGTGTDTVSYASASSAVIANLNLTTAQNTVGSGYDTLVAIENLIGSNYNDKLTGNTAANTLNGGSGNDTLIGGTGRDILNGGAGNDIFDFNALNESGLTSTTWDVIQGFQKGIDKIDLSTLDAKTAISTVNDTFTFIGTAAFTAAGQVRMVGDVLYANTDASLTTNELAIQIAGVTGLSATDFYL